MKRIVSLPLVVLASLFLPPSASAQTYWLGRQPDPKQQTYVFDVPVPPYVASALTCSDPKFARLKDGVREYRWEIDGKTYTFLENNLSWKEDMLERGSFAFLRAGAVGVKDWAHLQTNDPAWARCKQVLLAQKEPAFGGDWSAVTPVLLKSAGPNKPPLKVDFNDAPFQILRHPAEFDTSIGTTAATRKPQIVPAVHKNQLYIAWQSWDRIRPTGKIRVCQVGLDQLRAGKLQAVRDVSSGGTLVGFAIGASGVDHVLSAKAEYFENTVKGDFVDAVHKTWRPNILTLYTNGQGTDLNSERYTKLTFYGLCNAGTGRLVAGEDQLAAVFARRHYNPADGLIHQEANALVTSADLSRTLIAANNTVSHSFDQRLIFDGQDFVAIHQADLFPWTGLLIEKLRTRPGTEGAVRRVVFACPTFKNDVYFELGGVAADTDGYPVLFSATHNTDAVDPKNVAARREVAWDLAMAYVVRDFDTRAVPSNPYDVVGSTILAKGYAEPEKFTVENAMWNAATSDWTRSETRSITRQVCWLTAYAKDAKRTKKAACAKLIKLRDGKYVALWEEQVLADRQWQYAQTCATLLTITGDPDNKQIKQGPRSVLPGLRLHRGDDPVLLTIDGKAHAAWVTAGATNRQLLLHTLNEDLKHQAHTLKLP